jgi:hypothetical protein
MGRIMPMIALRSGKDFPSGREEIFLTKGEYLGNFP